MMATFDNPFTPTFGEIPLHLAGRDEVIRELTLAFKSSNRRPELSTIFSGARGTGKTALLSFLAERAAIYNWIPVGTTALPGMLEDIEIQTRRKCIHLLESESGARLASVGVPQILEVGFEQPATAPSNWRSRMTDMLEQLEAHDAGLLITVDEIDPALDEMILLAATYQHFVREGHRVALLMAGLPQYISALLSNKTASFLRRAQQFDLSRISDYEVEHALRRTISDQGREIGASDLDACVHAIQGFPFLLQLVGYHAWEQHPSCKTISSEDCIMGVQAAQHEMERRILEATYYDLSQGDIRFLKAMLSDARESSNADIVERLDRSPAQVSHYRRRLIDAGIIGERRRGVVGFDMPFFREFLQEKLAGDR